jgi:hypothetical protein
MVADAPTPEERTHAKERAKDQYLVVMFLVNSDKKRYGALVQDIENEYTRGLDTYPTSLSAAYDYIINYHASRNANTDINEGGVAFYTRDHDNDSGRGRGGCGRSGGHGSNSGGHGRGHGHGTRNQVNEIPVQECMHAQGAVEDEDDDAQFLVDNLDKVEDYLGFSCSSNADIPDTPTYWADTTRADFIAFSIK